MTVKRIKVI